MFLPPSPLIQIKFGTFLYTCAYTIKILFLNKIIYKNMFDFNKHETIFTLDNTYLNKYN